MSSYEVNCCQCGHVANDHVENKRTEYLMKCEHEDCPCTHFYLIFFTKPFSEIPAIVQAEFQQSKFKDEMKNE